MILIILTAANMGEEADEKDFDYWSRYVEENISKETGITVHAFRKFQIGFSAVDEILGATNEETETLQTWLSVTGWEAFCSGPWEEMAAEGVPDPYIN